MRRYTKNILKSLAAVAVVLALTGCAMQTHAQAKKKAYDRWADARAGILYSMAMQRFESGDLEEAHRTCLQGISARPEQADFYELQGRVLIERGELERAFQALRKATELEPKRMLSHYMLGVVLQRWEKYAEALHSYETAYQTAPDDVAPLLAMSEMLVKLGQTDQAIARLQDKLVYFEHNAAIRTTLGRIHMLRGESDLAVRLYREASLLSPEDDLIREQLALTEYATGAYGDAIYRLQRLLDVEEYKDRTDLRLTLSDCYLATGQTRRAGELLLGVTRQDPTHLTAQIKLGQVAWMLKDYPRLGEVAERVVKLAPQRYEGYMLHGMALQQTGQTAEALGQFDLATQFAPDNAVPHLLKGMALEQDGNLVAAAEAYRQALRVNPNDPRSRKLLAGLDPQNF